MTNNKTRVVFNMRYAARLIKMGHEVIEVLPNPENLKYNMWRFAVDETFDEDFEKILQERSNNGRTV